MPVVVADYADEQPFRDFPADCPFEVEFISGLVVGDVVLGAEGEAERAIKLQLRRLLRPGESPTDIDIRPVQANIGLETLVITAGWGNALQIDQV